MGGGGSRLQPSKTPKQPPTPSISRQSSGVGMVAGPQPDEASPNEPPPSFVGLIAVGTVVPDARNGPYVLNSYHDNVIGDFRGYEHEAGYDDWFATNRAIMAQQKSWGTVDFESANAVDPDYMFPYGTINGEGVNMAELRPVVMEAQRAMKAGSDQAFETACSKPGAAEAYERIATLPERSGEVRQPGGEQLDLVGLYKGGLGAVGELWEYGQQAIVASGEAGVAAWWGILKAKPSQKPNPKDDTETLERALTRALNANQAQRIWFKLATEYGGDISKVTDCAQISLGFATAEGLERAARFVLLQASTFKNRVANPTDEGYRDLTFTVLISGHICEVQLYLIEMVNAKKSRIIADGILQVCHRVLNHPVVVEDSYCSELTAKGELLGEGGRNSKGEKEGRGTMVYANGSVYEGQWRAGKRHGQGKQTIATGEVYEGEYVADKRHGRARHTLADGRLVVSLYEADAKVEQGVIWSADRASAWELQEGVEARSISLDEADQISQQIVNGSPLPLRASTLQPNVGVLDVNGSPMLPDRT